MESDEHQRIVALNLQASRITISGQYANNFRSSIVRGAMALGASGPGPAGFSEKPKPVRQGQVFKQIVHLAKEKTAELARTENGGSVRESKNKNLALEWRRWSRNTKSKASKQKSHATEDDDVPKRLKYFLDHKKISFLKQQFRHYDADQSGAISTDELQVFLKDFLGVVLDEDKLMEIIESVNPDNMGLLTFRDFVTVWYQYCSDKDSKDKIIQMAFEYLDKDQSKTISVDEFTEAMTTVGDPLTLEECKLFYQLLDKGKAQELSESEFEGFMREHFQTSLPMEGSDGGGGVLHYLMRYLNNI